MYQINECVQKARTQGWIVPGFNVFGYEDALAVVRGAEKSHSPVILMVNQRAIESMGIPHWGALLTSIANKAQVPVGVHLDHTTDLNQIFLAVESGFTSVMYDGSRLAISENITQTAKVVQYAHSHGVAVEAEVGVVPYSDLGEHKIGFTSVKETVEMVRFGTPDWLAVSVGNIHRLVEKKSAIEFELLQAIADHVDVPLVIHGLSGVLDADICHLRGTAVGKVNIGTSLRQAFANGLRDACACHLTTIDRLELMEVSIDRVEHAASEYIKILSTGRVDFSDQAYPYLKNNCAGA